MKSSRESSQDTRYQHINITHYTQLFGGKGLKRKLSRVLDLILRYNVITYMCACVGGWGVGRGGSGLKPNFTDN